MYIHVQLLKVSLLKVSLTLFAIKCSSHKPTLDLMKMAQKGTTLRHMTMLKQLFESFLSAEQSNLVKTNVCIYLK